MLLPFGSSLSNELLAQIAVGNVSEPFFLAAFGVSLIFLGSIVHRRGGRTGGKNVLGSSNSREITSTPADLSGVMMENSSPVTIGGHRLHGPGRVEFLVSTQCFDPMKPLADPHENSAVLMR
jgi:hypothetical protein